MTPHRLLPFSILVTAAMLASCNNSGQGTKPTSPASRDAGAKTATANYKEGIDYTVFDRVRIMDKQGFTSPAEAFSILLPKGWKQESEVFWSQPGSGCDGTNFRLKAESADGKYSIEFLPAEIWGWNDNADLRQMQANLPRSSPYCSFGPPMNAEEYVRNRLAPQELGNPEILKIEQTPAVVSELQRSSEKGRQEMMAYGASDMQTRASAISASVRWDRMTEGLILCGLTQIMVSVPNIYNGSVNQQITCAVPKRIVCKFPAGDTEQASRIFSLIVSSYRTNPYWQESVNQFWKSVRQQQNQVHVGRIRMMDQQTRDIGNRAIAQGNQRLKDMDVEMRNWEQKQSSGDRIHTEFIKTIRGVENYQDANGKFEMSAGYDHAWSRSDGTSFIMTNSPTFDPSGVFQDQQWKEMKKVD